MTRHMTSTAEHKTFETTMTNVTSEHEAGDVLHAAAMEVAEELERTQKDQGRLQDDLHCSCDDLAAAHEVICVESRKALHRTHEIKRKASEVQEGLSTHRERIRLVASEHARAEGHVNDGIGSLGRAVQAAGGVPDRESDEIKYLREATELTEAWQVDSQ